MDVIVRAVVKDVVTGAVGSLISKLGQLLKEEYKLHKNTRAKLKSLIEELECAHAALRMVAGVAPDQLDERVRIWAREVRDASYDMEDVIDAFLVRIDCTKKDYSVSQESFFKRLWGLMPRKLLERHKIAGTMDAISKRLEEVTQRHGRYTVVDNITVPRPAGLDPRLGAMYKEVSELVGIEKSSSELIAMLAPLGHDEKTERKMMMVSIVGVGGLGKTTLAKSVYDRLKVDFDCWAFVPFGRNPDLKKVLRDILIEIDRCKYIDPKITMLDERQLIDVLRENLRNKRYLLVFDDVWETKSWETIKLALVQENSGSRVITTTRILEVAKETGEVYKLQPLPNDKSKKLFYTKIFGTEGKCPHNQLQDAADKVLKKCDGVPLAIITMASLLVGKSRDEWIEVCSSVAFCDRGNRQVNDTEWILSLSYYDLPPHLKTCLMSLSVFPEDQVIRKDTLIWKWLAEGFVNCDKQGSGLFEVGSKYFNELINRNMIQVVESTEDDKMLGMVVGCRVHDMVLDLVNVKSQEENFVTVSSNNAEAISSPSRVRRLSHQNIHLKHTTQMDLGRLRSFVAYMCEVDEGFSFSSFKLLRVLALEHCSIGGGDRNSTTICLKHIENLLHLRYLGLGSSYIQEIPEEIGALKFLQTLDLEGTKVAREQMPLSVGQLTQLICLRARCMKVPNGVIRKLTSLEQLEMRCCEDMVMHFVRELAMLGELRVLYVEFSKLNYSMERDLVASLGNLHKIQNLELNFSTDNKIWKTVVFPRPLRCLIVPDIHFCELPLFISPSDLPYLTHLYLSVHYMEDQHLNILGQLPELHHLKLQIESPNSAAKVTVTNATCTSTKMLGCFQKLRSLSLPNSAVLFLLNEESSTMFVLNEGSSVSFTARPRDSRSMHSGTKKKDKRISAPITLMPNLQVLQFVVYPESDEVPNGIGDKLGLDCLPLLQRVEVNFWGCFDDVEREAAVLRQEIEGHPNRPRLQKHFRA